MEYRFEGGPFDGDRTSSRVLGDWVVLYYDEERRPTSAENAFALAAYKQVFEGGVIRYRFEHCLTPGLKKFQVEYADGPFAGAETSVVPMAWLPAELVLPLDSQVRAIRGPEAATRPAFFFAHYRRRPRGGSFQYCLAKIARAPLENDRQAA